MKEQYLAQITTNATALAQSFDSSNSLHASYFDRGYAPGGPNAFTPEELAAAGITAAQLSAMITLCEQLQRFRHNQSVTPADYDSTLNQLRRDL